MGLLICIWFVHIMLNLIYNFITIKFTDCHQVFNFMISYIFETTYTIISIVLRIVQKVYLNIYC